MQNKKDFFSGIARGIVNSVQLAYERGVKDGEEHREAKAIKNMAEYSQSRFQDGYERGLNDAWEVARRIENTPENGGLTCEQTEEMFGKYLSTCGIFNQFGVHEVLEKLKAWDKRDIITVGDEVTGDEGLTYIITRIYQGCYDAICPDGAVYHDLAMKNMRKTGRHFDVEEILGKLRGEE